MSNLKTAKNISKRISELMLDKKALDVLIINVTKITSLTDFFVICTSESDPQTRAISDHINNQLRIEGVRSWHTEGYENLDWVLIDYVNIVVHIFNKDARKYYEFERLWSDGIVTKIKDKK
tara:strand:- start:296 stop:658 length:363 start_codon:yes stop_codon:yes gene_type:complete